MVEGLGLEKRFRAGLEKRFREVREGLEKRFREVWKKGLERLERFRKPD